MNWTNYAFTGFETTAGTQGRKGTGAPTGPVQSRVGEKSGGIREFWSLDDRYGHQKVSSG